VSSTSGRPSAGDDDVAYVVVGGGRRGFLPLLLLIASPIVRGHAILSSPAPRPNLDASPGVKLQPFASAKTLADAGCGGTANSDPGVQRPTQAYTPGAQLAVSWQLTIPHPDDVLDSGVRIALHYDVGDSFSTNILAGGVEGDPPFLPVSAGPAGAVANAIESYPVTLPIGKTCDYCTLQWVWAARQDGGSYIGCADISITADGQLPNFDALPPLAPNSVLYNVPGQVSPIRGAVGGGTGGGTGAVGDSSGGSSIVDVAALTAGACGLGVGGGFLMGLMVAVITTPLAMCLCSRLTRAPPPPKQVPAANGTMAAIAMPPPGAPQPPPPREMPLPDGWTAAMDPASGREYFYHAPTGQTSWTRPQ